MVIIDNKDKRLPFLAEYLKDYNAYLGTSSDDVVVLPITGVDEWGYIKKTRIHLDDLYKNHQFSYLLTGQVNEYLKSYMKDKGILLSYYDEEIKKENGRLTAIGLLGIMISKLDFTIEDKSFLLLGYGACGKEIVDILRHFTKRIDVYNRTDYYDELASLGIKYLPDVKNLESLDYDIIINTIPCEILNEKLIHNQVIFDIASKAGFSEKVSFYHELGIPNLMPKSAALCLAKKIRALIEENINVCHQD